MKNKVHFFHKGLACRLLKASSPAHEQVVIICHGFGSSQNSSKIKAFTSALSEYQYDVLTFDFFGHGESQGAFEDLTISKCTANLASIIAWAHGQGYKHISLIGYSFGGLIGTLTAAGQNSLEALILVNPLSDYAEKEKLLGREHDIAQWKKNGTRLFSFENKDVRLNYNFYIESEHHSACSVASLLDLPMLIIHASDDEMVPIAQSKKLAKLSGAELKTIAGGDHRLTKPGNIQEVTDTMIHFLAP